MFTADDPQNPVKQDELLEMYQEALEVPSAGSVVHGKVVRIQSEYVFIDVGFKGEGICKTEEFKDEQGNLTIQTGDEVDVLVEKASLAQGVVILSKSKAHEMLVWKKLEAAFKDGTPVNAKVLKKVKGGLEVDIGVPAFMPASQADARMRRNLDPLLGQDLQVKIVKLNRRRENVVVSHRDVMEQETRQKKEELFTHLEEGVDMEGTVKSMTEYGAFVDLGGIDGLLHVSDISWGRIGHPKEMLKIGQQVQVRVLKFDRESEKISLGMKQLTEDPWIVAFEKYPPGKRITGKIVNLAPYGAFVELEPGVEGLLHVSEMSWKRIKNPSQVLTPGDQVEVVVTEVNPEQKRISLSLKQMETNPWDLIASKYKVGDRVKGKIRNLTDFGAFVELEEGVDGLVHVSDISRKTVGHPSEALQRGDEVEAVIIALDAQRQRISLSVKDLLPDEWDHFVASHEIGDILPGRVKRITEFGVFVEVAAGVEGLVHVSEIPKAPNQRIERMFKIGDEVKVRIIRVDKEARRLGLSMKDLEE
jgi:small subunit ribosomal protein S1